MCHNLLVLVFAFWVLGYCPVVFSQNIPVFFNVAWPCYFFHSSMISPVFGLFSFVFSLVLFVVSMFLSFPAQHSPLTAVLIPLIKSPAFKAIHHTSVSIVAHWFSMFWTGSFHYAMHSMSSSPHIPWIFHVMNKVLSYLILSYLPINYDQRLCLAEGKHFHCMTLPSSHFTILFFYTSLIWIEYLLLDNILFIL